MSSCSYFFGPPLFLLYPLISRASWSCSISPCTDHFDFLVVHFGFLVLQGVVFSVHVVVVVVVVSGHVVVVGVVVVSGHLVVVVVVSGHFVVPLHASQDQNRPGQNSFFFFHHSTVFHHFDGVTSPQPADLST